MRERRSIEKRSIPIEKDDATILVLPCVDNVFFVLVLLDKRSDKRTAFPTARSIQKGTDTLDRETYKISR